MSTPKLVNFPHFLDSRSWERNMSTPKLVNFHHFLNSRSWERNMSTPKLVNFPIFGFQGLRKNMYIYKYICTYVYYMILLYLEGSGSKFQSVNTKTSQFCPFFGVQELRKKHVNTKNSQFTTFFGFQELRKTCIYIYKYVHMYITWFCYIWRVVVLSFIPSTPKLVNFPHFLDSRS